MINLRAGAGRDRHSTYGQEYGAPQAEEARTTASISSAGRSCVGQRAGGRQPQCAHTPDVEGAGALGDVVVEEEADAHKRAADQQQGDRHQGERAAPALHQPGVHHIYEVEDDHKLQGGGWAAANLEHRIRGTPQLGRAEQGQACRGGCSRRRGTLHPPLCSPARHWQAPAAPAHNRERPPAAL